MSTIHTTATPPAEVTLARVAHELRGRLACIIYALQGAPPDGGAGDKARSVAERQAFRAARIVEDLFDVCAGGLSRISLRKETLSLKAVVWRAVETVEPQLVKAGLRLTVALPSDPPELSADSVRLEQVLANLLSNAAKFTPVGGRVWVTADVDGERVTIRVRDTGRGIPPTLLPHVFEPFVQDPEACSNGLGLGLAVVKSLVEAHSGSVAVASAGPGTGAEVTVRLPFTPGAGP